MFGLCTGPPDIRALVDNLQVACRKRSCAWRGKKCELETHLCPFNPKEYTDKRILMDIIYDDDRSFVKMKCIKVIVDGVINERAGTINRSDLECVYHFMKVYPWMLELQEIGLDLFIMILELEDGEDVLNEICNDLDEHMRMYHHVPTIQRKLMVYKKKRNVDMGVAADVLGGFRKISTEHL